MPQVLFLFSSAKDRAANGEASQSTALLLEKWSPSPFAIRPEGLAYFPYAIWWLFAMLRVFSSPGYSIFLCRDNGSIVHRSCVFPPYFRFPFMKATDLQIGDIWTSNLWRGRGLALEALRTILRSFPDRDFWYLCDMDNHASIALAARAGMKAAGSGTRHTRFGFSALGYFALGDADASNPASVLEK